MKAMEHKHEGASKRCVNRPSTDPKAILFVIDTKEHNDDNDSKAKTYINSHIQISINLCCNHTTSKPFNYSQILKNLP